MFNFEHKTALITGASSGIGAAFAKQLAAQGCHLVIVARREDRLLQLKHDLEAKNGINVTVISADLNQANAGQSIYQQVQAQNLHIDVLINNAGLGYHGAFLDIDLLHQQQTLAVNIMALTELTHLFGNDMKRRGQEGAILLVASIVAFTPITQFATYAASKAYVLSLGAALSQELKQYNIGVINSTLKNSLNLLI